MDAQPAFEVELAPDGSVRISGSAAVSTLMRLALAAKFQTELSWDHLLSPFVTRLIDELAKKAPMPAEDWANPAIMTPPAFIEAVQVIRTYREVHEPEADVTDLVRKALHPFVVPAGRLGL